MTSDRPDEFAWPTSLPPTAAVSESIRRLCTEDLSPKKPAKAPKGRELVIPIEHPAGQIPQDTQQVKAH